MISGLHNNAYIDPRTPKDAAGLDGIIDPFEMWELQHHIFDEPALQDARNFNDYNGHRFGDN